MKKISVDTNALTFFVQAIQIGYDPTIDNVDVAAEKIAILRIYFYTGVPYYIVPTVEREYNNIKNQTIKDDHESVHSVLMNDFTEEIDEKAIKHRSDNYYNFHPKAEDCRILAEAELANYDVLLTYDKRLIYRLKPHTKSIALLQPSEYWTILNIGPGTKPIVAPHKTNPLSNKKWWII